MNKRVTFDDKLLPYLLVAPQIIVTLVFFIWPSGQALWQSVILEDAFGGNTRFVGLGQFPQAACRRRLLGLGARHLIL